MHQTDRAFGLTFTVVFAVITTIGWLAFDAHLYWALIVAAVFLIAALACPGILFPFNRLWGRLVLLIGVFNNHLLLGLFFFVLVLPMGFTARLFGWDPMGRKKNGARSDSYWSPVSRGTSADTFRDPF